MKKKYKIIIYKMPFRALTHGRVKNSILDVNGNIFTPYTHSQAAAISSQNGVANNGPVTVQRNNNNQSNKQPKRYYARTLNPREAYELYK